LTRFPASFSLYSITVRIPLASTVSEPLNSFIAVAALNLLACRTEWHRLIKSIIDFVRPVYRICDTALRPKSAGNKIDFTSSQSNRDMDCIVCVELKLPSRYRLHVMRLD
jgi:hypothetical protein